MQRPAFGCCFYITIKMVICACMCVVHFCTTMKLLFTSPAGCRAAGVVNTVSSAASG